MADTTGRLPALRLVTSQEPFAGERRSQWAAEPRSLMALAVTLEQLVGPAADIGDGFLVEMVAWFERYGKAAEVLAEVSNGDAGLLRSLCGPPHDDDGPRPPGTQLLIAAALRVERCRR